MDDLIEDENGRVIARVKSNGDVRLFAYDRRTLSNDASNPHTSIVVRRDQLDRAAKLFSDASRLGFNRTELGVGLVGYGLDNTPGAKETVDLSKQVINDPNSGGLALRQSVGMVFGSDEERARIDQAYQAILAGFLAGGAGPGALPTIPEPLGRSRGAREIGVKTSVGVPVKKVVLYRAIGEREEASVTSTGNYGTSSGQGGKK